MSRRRILTPLAVLLLAAGASPTAAQEQSGFYPPQQLGAGGGGSWGMLRLDLPELDGRLAAMGLEALPEWMSLAGGGGVLNVGHLLVGGHGWGGSVTSEATAGGIVRSVRLDLSLAGVTLGWVKAIGRLKLTLGGTLGVGRLDLLLRRGPTATPDWNGVWDYYETAFSGTVDASALDTSSRLQGSFFWLEPAVGMRYWLIPLVAVDLGAFYSWGSIKEGKLRHEGEQVTDAPALDLSGMGFRVGVFFGF
jgi:hypothetical protein